MNTVWLVYSRAPNEKREFVHHVCATELLAERELATLKALGFFGRIAHRYVTTD